jgi:hypothetical protein
MSSTTASFFRGLRAYGTNLSIGQVWISMDAGFGIPASPPLSALLVESRFMIVICHTETLAHNVGALANLAANVGDLRGLGRELSTFAGVGGEESGLRYS